jgi:hypothetical protein
MELEEDYVQYAIQSSRQLCIQTRSNLPREIRDLIYEHVLTPTPLKYYWCEDQFGEETLQGLLDT